MSEQKPKLRVATLALAGCYGCHMSLLDIDERLETLLELVELRRSPLTDIERYDSCDVGFVEGGVCNAENVHRLLELRRACKTLVAVGACAINGGLPAQRNHLDIREVLQSVYLTGRGLEHAMIPNDPELPLPLAKVHPVQDVVKIDYFLPGCPPSGEAIWQFFTQLIAGLTPQLEYQLLRYD